MQQTPELQHQIYFKLLEIVEVCKEIKQNHLLDPVASGVNSFQKSFAVMASDLSKFGFSEQIQTLDKPKRYFQFKPSSIHLEPVKWFEQLRLALRDIFDNYKTLTNRLDMEGVEYTLYIDQKEELYKRILDIQEFMLHSELKG